MEKQKIGKKIWAGLVAFGLMAGVAWGAGLYTPGLPQVTLSSGITGNELIPADTQLPGGINPQTEAISMKAMSQFQNAPQAVPFAATIQPDYSQSALYTTTLTASGSTIAAPLNIIPGAVFRVFLTQDATGSRTVTWAAPYKWTGGTAPTLTTTAAAVDEITCAAVSATFFGCFPTLNVR